MSFIGLAFHQQGAPRPRKSSAFANDVLGAHSELADHDNEQTAFNFQRRWYRLGVDVY